MMTNAFIDELAKTIRELFDIEEQQTITSIAINHIISNLEEDLRQEAKIFQLSGNKSVENVLEFIVTKMEGNHLKLKYEPNVAYESVPTTTNAGKDGDRLDLLEQMVNNIASKLNVIPVNKSRRNNTVCSFCKKAGHEESRCFKKKTCHTCGVVGHIAKFCRSKALDGQTASLSTTTEDKNLVLAQRTIVEVETETKTINLLYDTGSQFSIITRTYNSLPFKQPLHRITQVRDWNRWT